MQLEDFRQELLRAIKELKMNPPSAPNYFTSVDVDSINITGSDDGNQGNIDVSKFFLLFGVDHSKILKFLILKAKILIFISSILYVNKI